MSAEPVDSGAVGGQVRQLADGVFEQLYGAPAASSRDGGQPTWTAGFDVLPPEAARAFGSMADAAVRFFEAGARAMAGTGFPRGLPAVSMVARPGETATALVFAHTRGTTGVRPRLVVTPLVGDDGGRLEAGVGETRVRAGSEVPSAVVRVRVPVGTPVGRYRGLVAPAGTDDGAVTVVLDVEA